MKNSLAKYQAIFFIFINVIVGNVIAQEDSCFPKEPKKGEVLVVDVANIIPDRKESMLNSKLVNFARETSNQIVVLTVDNLCGFSPNQYAYKVGDKWGVGHEDEDNGVIILVKPKTSESKGEVYIAPGRGLEGAIPDALARRITNEIMIPFFKKNQMVKGINEGVEDVMLLAKGEYNEEKELPNDNSKDIGIILFMFFLIGGIIVYTSYRRIKNYSILNNIPFWTAYNLLNQQSISRNGMPRHSRGGRTIIGGGGFPTRGGSGGFGGFGGGSFGGGGSGGSW